jgi:ComF family protein
VLHEAGLDDLGACGVCRRKPQTLDRVWTYGPYAGNLRQVIHLLKYDGMRPLAQLLGERCARQSDAAQQADLIVPAPLHWTKRLERGFNQSLLLAQAVARRQALPCVPRALRRKRATPPQAGLSGVQRRAGLRGAFAAKRELVEGKRILLVDDVVTTGATLEACAKALRRAGAVRVTAMAAARAQLARRAL